MFDRGERHRPNHFRDSSPQPEVVERVRDFVERTVKMLVEREDGVRVSPKEKDGKTFFIIQVNEGDYGKILGREGRTIKAIRQLCIGMGGRFGARFSVSLTEDFIGSD